MQIARTLGHHAPSSEDWTTEKYDAFGIELDTVHACVKENLGPEDVAYVKNVRAMSRLSEVAGRALIHFSLGPGDVVGRRARALGTPSVGDHRDRAFRPARRLGQPGGRQGIPFLPISLGHPDRREAWKKEHNLSPPSVYERRWSGSGSELRPPAGYGRHELGIRIIWFSWASSSRRHRSSRGRSPCTQPVSRT
jgi:hypothetical protein